MPQLIRERGDLVLFGFVRYSIGALPGSGPLMRALCHKICSIVMLTTLPGSLISSQVIFLALVLGAGSMGVCGNVPAFGSYLL